MKNHYFLHLQRFLHLVPHSVWSGGHLSIDHLFDSFFQTWSLLRADVAQALSNLSEKAYISDDVGVILTKVEGVPKTKDSAQVFGFWLLTVDSGFFMQDTDVLIKYINLFHACWAQMVVKVTETDHRGTQRERFLMLSLGSIVFFCIYIVFHLQS